MNSEKTTLNWVRLGLGVALFVTLFYWVPLDELVKRLGEVRPLRILWAFSITICVFLISALKLQIGLTAQNAHAPFLGVYRAYYVGSFFNNFIPSSVGGDIVKAYELKRLLPDDFSKLILAVVAERVSGVLALLGIAGYYVFFEPELFAIVGLSFYSKGLKWVFLVLVITLFTAFLCWLKTDNTSEDSWRDKFQETFQFPYRFPYAATKLFLLSFLFHFLRSLNYYFLITSLGLSLELRYLLFTLPIVALTSFLPISLGGIGLREGIITFCLHSFGLPLEAGFSVSILLRGFSLIHSGLGGLFYVMGPFSSVK